MFQISREKYFNTWSAKSPAAMMFLPARLSVSLGAYSFSSGAYTSFPFSEHIKLYEHDADGRYCRLTAEHNGTVLQLEYWKSDPWTVRGRVSTLANGEWGLRFLPVLTVGFEGDGCVSRAPDGSVAMALRSYRFAVALKDRPIRECLTDDEGYVGRRMEELGYYAPLEDAPRPRYRSFLYNLEETPVIDFALCAANGDAGARAGAEAALALEQDALDAIRARAGEALQQEGRFGCCAEALRDVMAWNTLADFKNGRVLTSLTRFWIDKKFGGWFLWLDDVLYHALCAAWSGDWATARCNICASMENAVPAGNLACLMSEFTEWVDRSQPPIFGYIVLKYYELTHDLSLVRQVFPTLHRAHLWWFEHRDGNGNGVLEYGSSPDCGDGHFKRTKLAAKDEAAMDNSPMYDSARFVPEAGTLNMEDVALNSLLALEGESLAKLARALGDADTAQTLSAQTDAFKRRIDERLWDEERGLYANRHWENGFVSPSPTSFYPLVAGIPTPERARRLVEHIFDESEFWTAAPLPSIWQKDPAVRDDVYWRGRMWPPLNFFTYLGLKRYGFQEEAHRLAQRSAQVFARAWEEERACYENYNTFTGVGKSVDADPFYGWGALLPLMWVLEFVDTDPDGGLSFGSISGEAMQLRHLRTYLGQMELRLGDAAQVDLDGRTVFRSNARGRFSGFLYESHYAQLTVPAQPEEAWVEFPAAEPVSVCVNGAAVPPAARLSLPAGRAARIQLWY